MDLRRVLRFVLIAEIVVLLCSAIAASRDYQDSWVLEGLEVPFAVFMITYTISFLFEKNAKWLVLFAVICRITILLIPNLKYVWFLGRSLDQHVQYSLAGHVFNEGYVGTFESETYQFYSNTPLLHLSFAIFSIVTETPLVFSYKLFPVLWSILYPLLTYFIVRCMKLPKEQNLLKYALFISSIPVAGTSSYIITGGLFGVLLSFLILSQMAKLLQNDDRRHLIVLFALSFALVSAHSFSSLQLVLLIVPSLILLGFLNIRMNFSRGISTALILSNLGWLTIVAPSSLKMMIDSAINSILKVSATGTVPLRFLELARIDIFEGLKMATLTYGANILTMFLTMLGLVFVVKMRKRPKQLVFISVFIAITWLFLTVGLTLGVGAYYYRRMFDWPLMVYPPIIGLLLSKLEKRRYVVVLLFSLIFLATITVYDYQPLVPTANVLSADLPKDEPLVYEVQVNSIYQRQMIEYVEKYVRGPIACDAVTRNQIYGLTRYNFSETYLTWFYPFSRLIDESMPEVRYEYFLTHLPGKSGAFQEEAEIRTRALILGALYNSTFNIVYSNSESYVLAKP